MAAAVPASVEVEHCSADVLSEVVVGRGDPLLMNGKSDADHGGQIMQEGEGENGKRKASVARECGLWGV